MTNSIDLYGVVGNPIKHSLSPNIFKMFAEKTGQPLLYQKILAPIDQFTQTIEDFRHKGGKGLNVTLPFKEQAFRIAQRHNNAARLAQSANTLKFTDQGDIFAANTDGVGLIRDIENNHHCNIAGKRILLIGAGGAAAGVIAPLLSKSPKQFHLANRTVEKAIALAKRFAQLGEITTSGFDDLKGVTFDLIINASSASLYGKLIPLPPSILSEHCLCYDMVYQPELTVFLQWAQKNGAIQSLDGLGMLVEQAAESFYIWRGSHPETQAIIHQLRKSLTS